MITVLGILELISISVADGCGDDGALWGCGGADDDADDDNNGAKLTLHVLSCLRQSCAAPRILLEDSYLW